MADVFRVHVPFSRRDPATRALLKFVKGDLVARPDLVVAIRGSEHRTFGHMTTLPDDHHAVLPHLPEGHPARIAALAALSPPPQAAVEHAQDDLAGK